MTTSAVAAKLRMLDIPHDVRNTAWLEPRGFAHSSKGLGPRYTGVGPNGPKVNGAMTRRLHSSPFGGRNAEASRPLYMLRNLSRGEAARSRAARRAPRRCRRTPARRGTGRA